MASEVLREYLVKLGFESDESTLKKFTGGIGAAAKGVAGFVAALEGMALAVTVGVAAMAHNLESLYFVSQRTGASASNLEALRKAAQNIAGAGEEALASVEGLARFMRDTPAAEGFIQSLGVQTRDANGQLRDTSDILIDLGRHFQQMDFYLAKQYAQMLGIGENALRALMSGNFSAEMEKQRDLLKDAGYEQAAKDAHDFEVKLRELETRIRSAGVTISNSLIDALGPQMDAATRWFAKNADMIAGIVASIGSAIVTVGGLIMPILGKIADGWKLIFDLVDRVADKILHVIPQSWVDAIGHAGDWLFENLGITEHVDAMQKGKPISKPPSGPAIEDKSNAAPGLPKTPMERAKQAMEYFQKSGWTQAQAAGIVANLQQESDFDPAATGDNGTAFGIAQWHPDRQQAFKEFSGKDIRESSFEDQLKFVNHELTAGAEKRAGDLLRAARTAQQAGEAVSRYYERPAQVDQEAGRRGAAASSIAQNVTINVNGASDPSSTARAVADKQKEVGSSFARNFRPAYT